MQTQKNAPEGQKHRTGWRPTLLRRRFRRYFGQFFALTLGMALGLIALPLILAGEIYEYQDTIDGVHLPDVDAIVCLAGGRGRIAAAGDLWYRYFESRRAPRVVQTAAGMPASRSSVPVLYISGSGPQSNWGILRRHLRSGVRDVIQPEHMVVERESVNTEANARWLARHISQTGPRWRRVILITSPYHMKRAQLIFQRVFQATGTSVQIDTLSAFQEPFEPGEWRSSLHGIHVTLTEYVKWVYYRFFWVPRA